MTATAARMRAAFTAGGSSCARGGAWAGFSAMVSLAPAFEEVDGEERDEGDREQDDGDRRRFGVGELLEPGHDEDRRDLGAERHVARDEDDRAVLAERAREGKREAGDDGREDRREDHAERRLQAVRAQARGGLLHVLVEAFEHGLQGTDHEGEADEDQHEHDAEPRVRPLDAERHQEAAVPAPGDEQVRVDEPGDRRREREGEVDERVEEALERELVAHQHPRHEDADPHVDDGRGERRPRLTVGASLASAVINVGIGVLVAWVLVRYEFPLKGLLDSLVDLPFALPTAVAGLVDSDLFVARGWYGRFLVPLGIQGAYSRLGIVLVLVFIGFPFVVRTLQPVLEGLDRDVEEAAACLGANRLQTVLRVIFPSILPAVITGFALAFARSLGEYGSVVFISGNMPFRTEIAPVLIVARLEEFAYTEATAIVVVLLTISFVTLFAINLLERWRRA